jgi:hypothetical protein
MPAEQVRLNNLGDGDSRTDEQLVLALCKQGKLGNMCQIYQRVNRWFETLLKFQEQVSTASQWDRLA